MPKGKPMSRKCITTKAPASPNATYIVKDGDDTRKAEDSDEYGTSPIQNDPNLTSEQLEDLEPLIYNNTSFTGAVYSPPSVEESCEESLGVDSIEEESVEEESCEEETGEEETGDEESVDEETPVSDSRVLFAAKPVDQRKPIPEREMKIIKAIKTKAMEMEKTAPIKATSSRVAPADTTYLKAKKSTRQATTPQKTLSRKLTPKKTTPKRGAAKKPLSKQITPRKTTPKMVTPKKLSKLKERTKLAKSNSDTENTAKIPAKKTRQATKKTDLVKPSKRTLSYEDRILRVLEENKKPMAWIAIRKMVLMDANNVEGKLPTTSMINAVKRAMSKAITEESVTRSKDTVDCTGLRGKFTLKPLKVKEIVKKPLKQAKSKTPEKSTKTIAKTKKGKEGVMKKPAHKRSLSDDRTLKRVKSSIKVVKGRNHRRSKSSDPILKVVAKGKVTQRCKKN